MRILTLGISHHSADVALRERAAFSQTQLPETLAAFRDEFPHVEAALLSTCNRTQWTIARPSHAAPDPDTLTAWWAHRRELAPDTLTPAVRTTLQGEAIHQLFRVTAGLDARVVGETDVQRQVKLAYDAAVAARTAGPVLHHVFQQALAAAKAARHETGLSQAGASIASAAVNATQNQCTSLDQARVLCVGAGEIAQATLRALQRAGVQKLTLVNRTEPRAQTTAHELGLSAADTRILPWAQLPQALSDADIIVSATSAETPVLSLYMLTQARDTTNPTPLLMFDLAMPRDVDPEVAKLPNVTLLDIDQLADTIERDPVRSKAIQRCEQRLEADAAACLTRVRNREIGQLIRQLRARMHAVADEERSRSRRKIAAHVSDDAQAEQLERLLAEHGQRLINKILHLPLQQLDAKRDDVALGFYATALRRLFDLDGAVSPGDQAERTPALKDPLA